MVSQWIKPSWLLTLRHPFDGDLKKSLLWNQMQAMLQLADWSSAEFRRLRSELEKHLMDDILAPRFIDPVAARKHLEALRWPDGAECPHCELINATAVTGGREGLYQCNSCREQFTVTVGTVFERSKIALNKWLLCNHLLCASRRA